MDDERFNGIRAGGIVWRRVPITIFKDERRSASCDELQQGLTYRKCDTSSVRLTTSEHLSNALRALDDLALLAALNAAAFITKAAKPGRQQLTNAQRLRVCELIVEERFGPGALTQGTQTESRLSAVSTD